MSKDGLVRVLDLVGYHSEDSTYEKLFNEFDSSFSEALQFDDFLEIMNFLHNKAKGMRLWLDNLVVSLDQKGTETYCRADMEKALKAESSKSDKGN